MKNDKLIDTIIAVFILGLVVLSGAGISALLQKEPNVNIDIPKQEINIADIIKALKEPKQQPNIIRINSPETYTTTENPNYYGDTSEVEAK